MWKTLREAMLVLVAGLSLALLANALSPRGLSLTRNYFPDVAMVSDQPKTDVAGNASGPGTTEPAIDPAPSAGSGAVERRLRQRGLEGIELGEVRTWVEDPRFEMELVILVDARNHRQYQEGHMPGAYSFDHFRPEDTLAELLPAVLAADQVIVYCSGGDCEDSEFAAVFLRDVGVAGDRLRVYTGGLQEWREAGLPIELGQRGSGRFE